MSPDHAKQPVIMQIIPALGAGGAEQGCIDVAAGLVNAGAGAIVVSHGGTRLHELERAGAVHIDLPVDSKNPFVMLKNARALRALIQKHNVSLVHVRSRAPAWSALRACRKAGIPLVTTCHAPYNIGHGLKRFYNSAITRGNRVIAISDYVAQYLRDYYNVHDSKIKRIHRGISLEKFHPTAVTPHRLIDLASKWRIPDGANVIILPGRLTRWKGHHILIDAMDRLRRKDVFCVIIGADQGRVKYRKELEETIQEKGLGGQVRIVDHCDDMPAAYMLATVVVSASTEPEGFGRVPVEAQAMGRPVIATDHGGAKETILREETGWLVPPGDPAALAGAIEQALSLNANQRAILATHAMAHIARNFTKEKMVEDTLDVYAELLRGKILPQETQTLPEKAVQ